jgi:hypothetical protein
MPLCSWWNSGYHEAFLKYFSFFHDGILAITKPFSRTIFFHDGILAITKPFSRTFLFFTMKFWLSRSLSHELFFFSRWNSGYHEAFLTNFSFFTMEFWLSQSLSHELFFFSRWNSGNTRFGRRLFLFIYHKEYLHRIRLVKNLASWFRAPFARKRVRSFLF